HRMQTARGRDASPASRLNNQRAPGSHAESPPAIRFLSNKQRPQTDAPPASDAAHSQSHAAAPRICTSPQTHPPLNSPAPAALPRAHHSSPCTPPPPGSASPATHSSSTPATTPPPWPHSNRSPSSPHHPELSPSTLYPLAHTAHSLTHFPALPIYHLGSAFGFFRFFCPNLLRYLLTLPAPGVTVGTSLTPLSDVTRRGAPLWQPPATTKTWQQDWLQSPYQCPRPNQWSAVNARSFGAITASSCNSAPPTTSAASAKNPYCLNFQKSSPSRSSQSPMRRQPKASRLPRLCAIFAAFAISRSGNSPRA